MLGYITGNRPIWMKNKRFILMGLFLWVGLAAAPATAWGPTGHTLIGRAAVQAADPAARAAVRDLLGTASTAEFDRAIDAACNWPDVWRERSEGAATAPLHYVNIPRNAKAYDRQRDCPGGLCVTEGILKFAAELGRAELGHERRRRAFAWLCHLVGDVHQPLHAGFRDDRGGNAVDVVYRGRRVDLHEFWDEALVLAQLERDPIRAGDVLAPGSVIPQWKSGEVAEWTNESHALAVEAAYPPGFVDGMAIDSDFADRSWRITRERWHWAALRLAAILNAMLTPVDAAEGR